METSDVSSSKYYVYLLYFYRDKGWYIGYTADLKARLILHAKGSVASTKSRIPYKLIHYEYFTHRVDAKAREKYLKSGYGREQLTFMLCRTLENLP